jgi:alcohol dehydrogenase class IV
VFSDIAKNPTKANVLSGVDSFKKAGCDSVVGFGGGASMDVARAIVLKAYHTLDLFEYDDAKGGDRFVTGEVPYFVTVPTTSGTGSEVGRSTVISDDVTHEKKILFSPKLLARKVFADPQLTMQLPAFVTATTGVDALTHNVEAYVAKGFSPLCEGIALEGIRLIGQSLERATLNPDFESRAKMMMASLMGATAFQKGLGIVHSLAHPLSTVVDMHHGLANAIMIPYGMEFNAAASKGALNDKFKNMAQACNLKDTSASFNGCAISTRRSASLRSSAPKAWAKGTLASSRSSPFLILATDPIQWPSSTTTSSDSIKRPSNDQSRRQRLLHVSGSGSYRIWA